MNLAAFQKLDRTIHEAGRMAIMSLLAANAELSFTELRDTLNMTDGNLAMHIKTLQQAGYVAVTKSFEEKRPRTTCSMTPTGRKAFEQYIATLAEIVKEQQQL